MKKKVWYKLGFFWRRGDNDGDDTAQDRDDGTGDLLFNTLTKIVKDGDKSQWAIFSFLRCAMMLMLRIRWTEEMNTGNEEKSRVLYRIRKLLNIKPRYRPQHDMTRDPYIAFGNCYTHLLGASNGLYDDLLTDTFRAVKIPRYLYSPKTWIWRRRLIKDNRKHCWKRLDENRAQAVVTKYDKFDEDNFYEDTPTPKK